MAQTWTGTRVDTKGLPVGILGSTNARAVTGMVLLSCTGPASSVSDGALLSVTSDLATYAFGGVIIARKNDSSISTYSHEITVSTGFDEDALRIVTRRCSTGELLSSNTSLTGETIYLMAYVQ